MVKSEICEQEAGIQMLDSCQCGYNKMPETAARKRNEEECRYWCGKLSLAGKSWCAKVFKKWDCQSACIFAVDLIKDGCYWCCDGGSFYKKCVKPFEDIASYMDISNCDPYWD